MDKYEELLEKTKAKEERFRYLDRMVTSPEIIADNRYWRTLLAEQEGLRPILKMRESLVRCLSDYKECAELLRTEGEEMKGYLAEESDRLSKEREKLYRELSELDIGKGGDAWVKMVPSGNKSEDFCLLLRNAFIKLCERENFSYRQEKNGLTVFGGFCRLRGESGIHRAIYASGTASVAVTVFLSTEKEEITIEEKDIRVDLFHSGGAGGQNINKVETAIRITHFPTGIVVTCQDERSQLQNKNKAFASLQKKLTALREKEEREERERIEKKFASVLVRTYDMEKDTATGADRKKYSLSELMNGEFPY